MRTAWLLMWLLISVSCISSGCSFKDSERCPQGYEYVPEFMACQQLLLDGATTDTSTADGKQATDLATGFNQPCKQHADCVGEADFCTYNDLLKSGSCTFQGCTADSCPLGWLCCDCKPLAEPLLCGPEDEPLLQQFCSCMARSTSTDGGAE